MLILWMNLGSRNTYCDQVYPNCRAFKLHRGWPIWLWLGDLCVTPNHQPYVDLIMRASILFASLDYSNVWFWVPQENHVCLKLIVIFYLSSDMSCCEFAAYKMHDPDLLQMSTLSIHSKEIQPWYTAWTSFVPDWLSLTLQAPCYMPSSLHFCILRSVSSVRSQRECRSPVCGFRPQGRVIWKSLSCSLSASDNAPFKHLSCISTMSLAPNIKNLIGSHFSHVLHSQSLSQYSCPSVVDCFQQLMCKNLYPLDCIILQSPLLHIIDWVIVDQSPK